MLKAPAARAAAASVWLIAAAAHAQAPDHAAAPAAQPPSAPTATESAALPQSESDPARATVAGSRRIQVLIAAEPEQRERLARVLRELMARLSVEVELAAIERVELRAVLAAMPPDTPYLARCYLDLRGRERAALYVHDPARDRILERWIDRAPGDDELAREQLGHMLLAAIEGLLAGASLGAPRSEVAAAALPAPDAQPRALESESEPAPQPDQELERAAWSLRGALLYEVAALGHGPGIAHGPALALAIRSPLSRQLGVLLSAQYRLPFEVDAGAEPLAMRMSAVALRALATLETPLAARVSLRAGLGAGADLARISPETSSAEVRASAARTLTLGVARALLGVDYRISPVLALWGAVTADVDLDRAQYVLVRSDGSEVELSAPWRIRPALSLGVVLP